MIDCYSKKVVGWSIADHMRTELVEDALRNTAATSVVEPGAVFHPDRGSVGEFQGSSQHLDERGVFDGMAEGSEYAVHRTASDAVAGAACAAA